MNGKVKLINILAGLLLSTTILAGCNSTEKDELGKITSATQLVTTNIEQTDIVTSNSDSVDRPLHISDFKYDAIVGDFYDGIARFEVSSYSGQGVLHPDLQFVNGKYGYIDATGTVICAPGFQVAPEKFEEPVCVMYELEGETGQRAAYLTKNGFLNFTYPTGKISNHGSGSNGLFWIESVDEQVSGNIYTMTYYNKNGEVAFSISNAQSVNYYGDFITTPIFGEKKQPYNNASNFNQYGYAFVEINGNIQTIKKNGEIVLWECESFEGDWGEIILSSRVADIAIKGIDYDSNRINCNIIYYSANQQKDCKLWDTAMIINYDEQKLYFTPNNCPDEYFNLCNAFDEYWISRAPASGKVCFYSNSGELLLSVHDLPAFSNARISALYSSSSGKTTIELASPNNVIFYSIIDTNGNVLLEPTKNIRLETRIPNLASTYSYGQPEYFYSVSTFSDGLCAAYDKETDRYGYINEKGEWIIKPQFIYVRNFSDGLACVNENTFIDTTGKTVFTFNQ